MPNKSENFEHSQASTRTLVIVPLFNEANTIAPVIRETRRYYDGDILVVDDGSTDNSVEQLRTLQDPRVRVLSHDTNMGYGRSLIDGFKFAIDNGYHYAITMDCDLQHEPASIPSFIDALKDADVVSGSRYFFDFAGNSDAPVDRFRINRIVSDRINALTGYNLTDAFCGFKAYRVCALKKVHLDEEGYAMPLQFWIQAWGTGLRVKEIPVKRIYLNLKRQFGSGLDDPDTRLAYYNNVIDRELTHVDRCTASRCASR